jgi:hypothetical protein
MHVAIVGDFDSSGSRSSQLLTLAGYVASPEVWTSFDSLWRQSLAEFVPPCKSLHMVDAANLRKEFAMGFGWTKDRVSELLKVLRSSVFLARGMGGAGWTVVVQDRLHDSPVRRERSMYP